LVETIVFIKRAVDVQNIKLDPSTSKPLVEQAPKKFSDFDKNALEAAIVIKEKLGGTIKVITLGEEDAQENLREALAMGADEAFLCRDPTFGDLDYFGLSNVLASAAKKSGNFDLIICGELSQDWFSGQVGPRVAEILGLPQITNVKGITAEESGITGEREVGDVVYKIQAPFPALVTVTKVINEPRLPTLMQIMGASSKPLTMWGASDLDMDESQLGVQVCMSDVEGLTMERKKEILSGELPDMIKKLSDELGRGGISWR